MKKFKWLLVVIFAVGLMLPSPLNQVNSSVYPTKPISGKWEAVRGSRKRFVILKNHDLDLGLRGRIDHFYRVRSFSFRNHRTLLFVKTDRHRTFRFRIQNRDLVWYGQRLRPVDLIR